MNIKEIKQKLKNKEPFGTKEIREMLEIMGTKLAFLDRFNNEGRGKLFIQRNRGTILDTLNHYQIFNLTNNMPEITSNIPGWDTRVTKALESFLETKKYDYEFSRIIGDCFNIAYPDEDSKEKPNETVRSFLEENFEKILDHIGEVGGPHSINMEMILSDIENKQARAKLMELIKMHPAKIFEQATQNSLFPMIYITNNEEYMKTVLEAMLSGHFKDFFDRMHSKSPDGKEFYDAIGGDHFLMATVKDSKSLMEEVTSTFKDAFEREDLTFRDFYLFTETLKISDPDYLYERLELLKDIIPANDWAVKMYLKLLENNPDSDKSMELLEKLAKRFVTDPNNKGRLGTFREIQALKEKLEEKTGTKSKINIEELLDSIVAIANGNEIKEYLELLDTSGDASLSLARLERHAEILITNGDNYFPLSTLKKIIELKEGLEKAAGKQSSIDSNELKEKVKPTDIAWEMVAKWNETTIGAVDPSECHDFVESLGMIIGEIIEDEKCDITDIEALGKGGFSTAFRIGEKVLKFGIRNFDYRERMPIPQNHPRILQPLARLDMPTKVSRREYPFFVEVEELCDTSERATDEDVFQVYKELRESGIIWDDPKPENLARLKKPNKVYFGRVGQAEDNGKVTWGSIEHAGEGTGIEETKEGQEILGPGEWVIIDLDFLYRVEDFEKKRVRIVSPRGMYEERYQKEMAKEKGEQEEAER